MPLDTMPVWFWAPLAVVLWGDLILRTVRALRATPDRPRR